MSVNEECHACNTTKNTRYEVQYQRIFCPECSKKNWEKNNRGAIARHEEIKRDRLDVERYRILKVNFSRYFTKEFRADHKSLDDAVDNPCTVTLREIEEIEDEWFRRASGEADTDKLTKGAIIHIQAEDCAKSRRVFCVCTIAILLYLFYKDFLGA